MKMRPTGVIPPMTTPFAQGRRDRFQAGRAAGRLADRRRQPRHGGGRFDRRGAYARSRGISRPDGGDGRGRQGPRARDRRHHRRLHPRRDPARQAGARHERRGAAGDAGALSVQAGRAGDGRSFPPHGRRNRHADHHLQRGAVVVSVARAADPHHERGAAGGRRQAERRRPETVRRSHDDGAGQADLQRGRCADVSVLRARRARLDRRDPLGRAACLGRAVGCGQGRRPCARARPAQEPADAVER